MAEHLVDAAFDALMGEREDAHGHKAHMGDRRIGDQLLHILLRERDQRGVDDRDDGEREDEGREHIGSAGEHRQREAQEAVTAHLQQDARQDHRARRRGLDVGIGQPGVDRPHRHLHRERGEEGEPQPALHRDGEMGGAQQHVDIGGARIEIHPEDGEQHQHRAEQGVEEELHAGVNAPLATPHADDEIHRDQAAFEEDVEQHKVERTEHADHQRLEDQERDHVLAHPLLDRGPGRQDAERHEARGEHDEQHRNAIHPHVVGDVAAQPLRLFDELEGGRCAIEIRPDHKRQREIGKGDDERDPARGLGDGLLVAGHQEDRQHAQKRQEGGNAEDRPAHSVTFSVTRNHVISATTPKSMASA